MKYMKISIDKVRKKSKYLVSSLKISNMKISISSSDKDIFVI